MELWNSNKFPFRDIDNFFNWILFYFALNNELYLFWTRFKPFIISINLKLYPLQAFAQMFLNRFPLISSVYVFF